MRVVVAITGASGATYARRLLTLLAAAARGDADAPVSAPPPREGARGPALDVHWVTSSNAPLVWRSELGEEMPATLEGARRWDRLDFNAPFASGSSPADAVVFVPCSMSNLARVAHGGGDDLVARAAEVALKERKKLILVVRETPLSLPQLKNMVAATEAGALVLPAVPSFYAGVRDLDAAVDTVVARILDQVGVPHRLLPRWGEPAQPVPAAASTPGGPR
jgi:polyprenyl P-hydroxybenzoate/phenylacrylic acid decarboxylase-like protein